MSPMNHGRGKVFLSRFYSYRTRLSVEVNASFFVSLRNEANFTSDLALTEGAKEEVINFE
jgi:hypothetical protein